MARPAEKMKMKNDHKGGRPSPATGAGATTSPSKGKGMVANGGMSKIKAGAGVGRKKAPAKKGPPSKSKSNVHPKSPPTNMLKGAADGKKVLSKPLHNEGTLIQPGQRTMDQGKMP